MSTTRSTTTIVRRRSRIIVARGRLNRSCRLGRVFLWWRAALLGVWFGRTWAVIFIVTLVLRIRGLSTGWLWLRRRFGGLDSSWMSRFGVWAWGMISLRARMFSIMIRRWRFVRDCRSWFARGALISFPTWAHAVQELALLAYLRSFEVFCFWKLSLNVIMYVVRRLG